MRFCVHLFVFLSLSLWTKNLKEEEEKKKTKGKTESTTFVLVVINFIQNGTWNLTSWYQYIQKIYIKGITVTKSTHTLSHTPPPPPQQFMIKCGNAYSPWYRSWINNAGCHLLLVRSGTQQYCSGTCIPQSTFCAYKESNWDSNETSSSPITFQKWIIKYKDKKINRRVWLLWKIKQPHTNTISEPRVWY